WPVRRRCGLLARLAVPARRYVELAAVTGRDCRQPLPQPQPTRKAHDDRARAVLSAAIGLAYRAYRACPMVSILSLHARVAVQRSVVLPFLHPRFNTYLRRRPERLRFD